jgi:flagellar protein FliO/FliZ
MKRSLPLCTTTILGGFLLLPVLAFGADGEATPLELGTKTTAQDAPGAGGGGLVRTIVGLAIVLGVIYGLHWVLKQVKASKEAHHVGSGLSSLGTLPLGPNRSLHLVRAGTEVVLVGVGEGGVTPIRVYTDAEALESGLITPGEDGGGSAAPSVSLPALMDAGPETVPQRIGRSLKGGSVRQLVEDLRARTVIR